MAWGTSKRRNKSVASAVLAVSLFWDSEVTQAFAVSAAPKKLLLIVASAQQVDVLLPPPSLLPVEVQESPVYLKPSRQTLRRRLEATAESPEIAEGVRLAVREKGLRAVVSFIAGASLRQMLEKPKLQSPVVETLIASLEERVDHGSFEIDARDLKWLDLSRLASYLRVRSRVPFVDRESWENGLSDPATAAKLTVFFGSQWPRFRDADSDAASKQDWGAPEQADADPGHIRLLQWLPSHMRAIYGRFSSFRGRNCFATALMFADEKVVRDSTVNIVREEEHHVSMINSDEFLNALWRGYSMLTEAQVAEGLRFGDVVAFVDTTKGQGFRAFLHAAIHVGGEYYFHKPSKSASSPVEFTRWYEMVRVWQAHAGSLSYLVFRKNPLSSAKYIDNRAFSDKISWTP